MPSSHTREKDCQLKYLCAHCGREANKPAGHVNRARARGLNLYCNRKCSGFGRRDGKTKAQRVEEKRLYDIEYRAKNREMLKRKHREYHVRTYDPVVAAAYRKKRMPKHVEYCRQPEYRVWKKGYDRKYRSKKLYGPFDEAFMVLMDLDNEIKQRSNKYEIYQQNGTLNKTQTRRRASKEEPERTRKRQRQRRPSHSAAYSG